jgi:hypothetical protein
MMIFMAVMLAMAGSIAGQTIGNVKIGYEIDSQGPFPTSIVYQQDTLIIRWDKADLQGEVTLDVRHPNNTLVHVIAAAHPCGDIPKAFTIPASLLPGSYHIRVSQGPVSGQSAPFTVKPPRSLNSVTVFLEGQALPAAFHPGQTVAVSWQAKLLGKIKIVLKKGDSTQVMVVSQSRDYNDIPATFNLPAGSLGEHFIEVSQGSLKARSPLFRIALSRWPGVIRKVR